MSGFKRFDILDLLLQCLLPFPPLISLLNFFNSTTDLILIDRLVLPSTIIRCLQEWPETKRCLQGLSDRVVALELEFDRDALRSSGCCFGADWLSVADEAEVQSSAADAKVVVVEGVGVAGGGRPWSALVPYCSQPREAPEICSLDPSSRTFYL